MEMFMKGDFIKLKYGGYGSFYIYDGEEVEYGEYSTYKAYKVLLFYDPCRYNMVNGEWKMEPYLFVDGQNRNAVKTIDTCYENGVYEKLNDEEMEEAMKSLDKLGYEWDKESLTLINKSAGAPIANIKCEEETVEYHGEEVKPTKECMIELLSKECHRISEEKGRKSYESSYYDRFYRNCYDDYYDF